MSYDFGKVSSLLGIYVTIMKEGISQLNPVAHAAMDELKQMMEDESNAATFTDPNPGVDDDVVDEDGDGLVTKNDQNIEDGVEGDEDGDVDPPAPVPPRRPIPGRP